MDGKAGMIIIAVLGIIVLGNVIKGVGHATGAISEKEGLYHMFKRERRAYRRHKYNLD